MSRSMNKKVCFREELILAEIKEKSTLSVGLGGQTEDTDYSFNLLKLNDVSFTISAKMARAASEVEFIDISDVAIKVFENSNIAAKYHCLDITSAIETWPHELLQKKFSRIVLGEVLEHIDNPGIALRNISHLLDHDGKIIITVPNAFFIGRFLKLLLLGREQVHQEHVCYYSAQTISRLISISGLEVEKILWARWSRFQPQWILRRFPHLIAYLLSVLFYQTTESVVAIARRPDF